MPLNLDPTTYGRTPACLILVEKLNGHNDARLASMVSKLLSEFSTTCRDLIRLPRRTRARMLRLALDDAQQRANDLLHERMDQAGIPYSYVHNILHHRFRQASEHANIIDRFNEDGSDEAERDYKAVLDKLVDIDRKRDYQLLDARQN